MHSVNVTGLVLAKGNNGCVIPTDPRHQDTVVGNNIAVEILRMWPYVLLLQADVLKTD